MPTKDEIDADNQRLEQENVALKAQLAAAISAGRTAPGAQHVFQLSEGDRQELEIRGVVAINGRLMTRADVVKAMAAAGQKGVTIKEAPAETALTVTADTPGMGPGVRGIDYIYPSVERGKIDPAVAGTPGINGPAADTKPAADVPADDLAGE
jgi:hypothetical protein